MTKLIKLEALDIIPEPARKPGTSLARTRARALRAWRRGELVLAVQRNGVPVKPEQIDWDSMPKESANPGGRNATPPRSVRLSGERSDRLSALAKRWGVSENEAVGRAIDAVFSAETTGKSA